MRLDLSGHGVPIQCSSDCGDLCLKHRLGFWGRGGYCQVIDGRFDIITSADG